MAQYETEEQQVEALKKWWAENGKSIIAGVVLGIAVLFGWRGWGDYQQNQAADASARYQAMTLASEQGQLEKVNEYAGELRDDYSGTVYAGQGSLLQASLLASNGKLEEAAKQLEWTRENATETVLRDIATIRLAQVQVALGQPDQALSLLEPVAATIAYTSLIEEIRGDAFRAKGDIEAAREAYDRAILSAGADATEYLRLKRADLGS